MRTLIVYGTKYGTSKKCSELLKNSLKGDVELCNLKKEKNIDLNAYDNVVIGSSIYIGQIRKEVKTFISNNLEELLSKKIGLFVCGMDNKPIEELIKVYDDSLVDHALVKEKFGGEIIFKNLTFFHRLIVRMVSKADNEFPKLDENKNGNFLNYEAINSFASVMND